MYSEENNEKLFLTEALTFQGVLRRVTYECIKSGKYEPQIRTVL